MILSAGKDPIIRARTPEAVYERFAAKSETRSVSSGLSFPVITIEKAKIEVQ